MTEVIEKTIEDIQIDLPKNWNVIFHNDDTTPFSYVVMTLINVFDHPVREAFNLTSKIQENGKGVVGNYPKPIAEEKVNEVMEMNRLQGFDLQVTLEEEN